MTIRLGSLASPPRLPLTQRKHRSCDNACRWRLWSCKAAWIKIWMKWWTPAALGNRTLQRNNRGGGHFIANSRQTLPPFSVQHWPPRVQYFRFNRLSQQIMSLCFACITQCHLVTLKRGLFGGSAALLSWEWVVNCQGAACVFLPRHNAV